MTESERPPDMYERTHEIVQLNRLNDARFKQYIQGLRRQDAVEMRAGKLQKQQLQRQREQAEQLRA